MKGKFFLVYYVYRPRNKSLSHLPNQESNLAMDEMIGFATKLTDKDMLQASIILDLDRQTVIRSRHDLGKDYAKLYEYYINIYSKEFHEFRKQFKSDSGDDRPGNPID